MVKYEASNFIFSVRIGVLLGLKFFSLGVKRIFDKDITSVRFTEELKEVDRVVDCD